MGLVNAMEVADNAVSSVDFSGFITALTSSITPAQLLAVLASVVGIGMTFFLMWFGIRKAVRIFTNALSKGKLSL